MKKQIITLTVAALTLSSCGIYTKYKPATEVPDNLYGEEVAVADTVDNIGNLSWQEIFTDPRLQELIEQGLRNNTDLQSAQWRVKEAEAAMLSAKLAYLPSFALSPQGTASSFDKGKAAQTYTLPVAASWEIDIFGRIRNAKRQAKALLEQSRDYKQAVRTQLIAGIANTYYTLLMLDNQLAISVRTEKSWKETVDATRALMEAGLANEAAVSQMEAMLQRPVCGDRECIGGLDRPPAGAGKHACLHQSFVILGQRLQNHPRTSPLSRAGTSSTPSRRVPRKNRGRISSGFV